MKKINLFPSLITIIQIRKQEVVKKRKKLEAAITAYCCLNPVTLGRFKDAIKLLELTNCIVENHL